MKNLYYLKRNIEYRFIEFYELLTTYRKQVVIAVSLVLITLSFFCQDWARMKLLLWAVGITPLVKIVYWEAPEMIYKYFANKEVTDIKKQRRFDNYTLPIMWSVLIVVFVVICIKTFYMATTSPGYYPHWKSDINNMWANKFMQWVVDNLFPVKTYYSTFK